MTRKEITCNYTHDTVAYGKVYNDTVEYYTSSTECFARGQELRANSNIAYVRDGYWWAEGAYRVAYAYKA